MAENTSSANKSPAKKASAKKADSVKDAFREALERKKQQNHPHEEHRDGHGAGPSANDKVQRQFRRKSG